MNHFGPRDVYDDYFINRECPEAIRYLEDGAVDWDQEYSRFFDMINDHVSGRTLSSTNEMVERGKSFMNTVVYSGKEHDLLSYGRMRIVCDVTGEVGFFVHRR